MNLNVVYMKNSHDVNFEVIYPYQLRMSTKKWTTVLIKN
jgi:hypothetical protein